MVHLIFLLEVLVAINFTREFNSNVHECCFNKDQNKLGKIVQSFLYTFPSMITFGLDIGLWFHPQRIWNKALRVLNVKAIYQALLDPLVLRTFFFLVE